MYWRNMLPTEHVRDFVDRRLAHYPSLIAYTDELWAHIQRIWNALPQ